MPLEFSSRKKVLRWADRILDASRGGEIRPVHLALHITNRCTHNCPSCNGGRLSNPQAELEKCLAIRVAKEADGLGVRAVTFGGGGDPLAHPQFAEIAAAVADIGLLIGIITNGAILSDRDAALIAERCSWARISLDAASDSQYRLSHGESADWGQTLRHLRRLTECPHRKVIVGTSFLTRSENAAEIADAARIADENGADYIIFRPYDRDTYDASAEVEEARRTRSRPEFEVVAHYERIQDSARSYSRCHGMLLVTEIAADGNVYPCCHWKNLGRRAYGNIRDQGLDQVLQSDRFLCAYAADVRKLCPPNCRHHVMNGVIEETLLTPIPHEEFL